MRPAPADKLRGPRWRLSRMFAPLRPRLPRPAPGCGGGRPAKVSPQAQYDRCGPLFRRSLGLAPRPTQNGAPRAPHALPPRRAADRCALLRGFGLGRSAIVASRRGRLARLALPGRTLRGPARSAARRPFVAASAPGGRGSSLRSSPGVRSRAAPCSLPSPALRGPGFLPGPLPLSFILPFNY